LLAQLQALLLARSSLHRDTALAVRYHLALPLLSFAPSLAAPVTVMAAMMAVMFVFVPAVFACRHHPGGTHDWFCHALVGRMSESYRSEEQHKGKSECAAHDLESVFHPG